MGKLYYFHIILKLMKLPIRERSNFTTFDGLIFFKST